jgi:hypothetical protein
MSEITNSALRDIPNNYEHTANEVESPRQVMMGQYLRETRIKGIEAEYQLEGNAIATELSMALENISLSTTQADFIVRMAHNKGRLIAMERARETRGGNEHAAEDANSKVLDQVLHLAEVALRMAELNK